MAKGTLAKLLIEVGAKITGDLKVESAIKNLKQRSKEYKDASNDATDAAGRGYRKLGATIRGVAARSKVALAGMVKSMGGLKNIAMAGAAALGTAAIATFAFVNSQTSAIDGTNELSRTLGMGVEELQRLQYAASMSGVSAAGLQTGIRKLNANLLEMQQGGGKKAKEALAALGLGLKDLENKSTTEQIGIIGDRLNGVANEADRAALAGQIFGKTAGPEMVALLGEGQKGLESLTAAAKNVWTQEDADRASQFQDQLADLRTEVDRAAQIITVALLPAFIGAATDLKGWLDENDKFISQDLPATLNDVAEGMRRLGGALGKVASAAARIDNSKIGGLVTGLPFAAINRAIAAIEKLGDAYNYLAGSADDASRASGDMTDEAHEKWSKERKERRQQRKAAKASREGDLFKLSQGETLQEMAARLEKEAKAADKKAADDERLGRKDDAAKAKATAAALRQQKKEAEEEERRRRATSSYTMAHFRDDVLAGRADALRRNLHGIAGSTPRANDIKPTVAMTINNAYDVDVHQAFHTSDPTAAANQSVAGFKAALAKAGQSLANVVVR